MKPVPRNGRIRSRRSPWLRSLDAPGRAARPRVAPPRAQGSHDKDLVILDDVGVAPFACRVTSSRPGHFPYVVTLTPGPAHGCDCEGYFRWERCKHYALYVETAGWLPDVELLADGDCKELDDHELWDAAVASAAAPALPVSLMSRADRRAAAPADLAQRQDQAVAS